MLLKIIRSIIHVVLPTNRPLFKFLKSISINFNNLDIIEIGSGDLTKKQSAKELFTDSNSFLQTDINNEYDHYYLDITKEIQIEKKFDLVICTNVLEHVFETEDAIRNLKSLMKKNGYLIVSVPFIYPLHDEPTDFWRFTEHALKRLFNEFEIEIFKKTGLRKFPSQYILLLKLATQ